MAKHTVTIIQPARTTLHSDYTMEIKSYLPYLQKLDSDQIRKDPD